jgi:hypothetical protein
MDGDTQAVSDQQRGASTSKLLSGLSPAGPDAVKDGSGQQATSPHTSSKQQVSAPHPSHAHKPTNATAASSNNTVSSNGGSIGGSRGRHGNKQLSEPAAAEPSTGSSSTESAAGSRPATDRAWISGTQCLQQGLLDKAIAVCHRKCRCADYASSQLKSMQSLYGFQSLGISDAPQHVICLRLLSRLLPALAAKLLDPATGHKLVAVQDTLRVLHQ